MISKMLVSLVTQKIVLVSLHRVVSRSLIRSFHPKSRRLFPFYFSNITLTGRTGIPTYWSNHHSIQNSRSVKCANCWLILTTLLTDELPDQYIIVTQEGGTLRISGLFHAIVLLAVLFFRGTQTKNYKVLVKFYFKFTNTSDI